MIQAWFPVLSTTIGILVGVLGISLTAPRIHSINSGFTVHRDFTQEALYLPSQNAVEFISFGYKNVAAHIMWFKTISYFGKHYSTDKDLRWLHHMCMLTVTLNPRARHPYQFCANMLSWEAEDASAAVEILDRAVYSFPDDFFFYYLRGFVKYYFLKDAVGAKDDFIASAKRPGASTLIARLAAKQLAQIDTPDAAIEFLQGMLANERNPRARQALFDRLKEALRSRDLAQLEEAVRMYKERMRAFPSSIHDLASAKIIEKVIKDPFGGEYVVDPLSGSVSSTSIRQKQRGSK